MSANAQVAERPQWWKEPFAVFQTNLQEIDADLNVESTLDTVLGHGADTWMLNAGGILSFFPTTLPFQTPSPYLSKRPSGDLLGDAVEAAHARGVRVIARFDFSKVTKSIANEHPEWCFRTQDGEPQIFNGLWSVCPSGDYYQKRSFDILDEVLDRYPIDGVFFNWFNFNIVDYNMKVYGICHCASCTERFREWSGGEELPTDTKSPRVRDWVRFTTAVLGDLNTRIAEHIRARSHSILVIQGKQADMRYSEAHKMPGKELWPHSTGEAISELQHHEPPVPALVNAVSFVDAPYRMGGEEPAQFAQYLAQGIARGGMPSTYIMGAPGRIPYPSLPVAGEITRFFRAHTSDIYSKLTPAARIAVVKAPSARPGSPPSEEYLGVYTMLQRSQRPFDVIPLDQITALHDAGRLCRFDLVILPDVSRLGSQAPTLDSYVDDGGHVLLTGGTGFTAEGNSELVTSPALRRGDRVRTGTELKSAYATTAPQPEAFSDIYQGPLVPVMGTLLDCVWADEASGHGAILPPTSFAPPEKAHGHRPSADEAAYWRRNARSGGSVTVVPWTIGQSYREVETSAAAQVLLEIVDGLATPRLEITAPESLEVVVSTAGDDLILHLLNLSGAGRRGFRPPAPLTAVGIRLLEEAPSAEASALVSGMRFRDVNSTMEVTVRDHFEVLQIRGAAGLV
ncbi:alpha-amylase family protein [Nesterenkonia rhizosphaerae]|uniref:alpha-amylase family protein n=1 Tax=Nesterenkonia rhizosphaerae TaxID=1348272 RepID=UPI0031F072AA